MPRKSKAVSLFVLMRPYQWIKNGFVVLPLVFSGRLLELDALVQSAVAGLVFCAASSAVYILNDLFDLESDRAHPVKKLRPLAQGHVAYGYAFGLAASLALAALAVGFYLGTGFGICVAAYLCGNLLYTFRLKEIVIIDVLCLGLFFMLRVIAGAVVLHVKVSPWLLICTAILSLFLGFNKRRHEIMIAGREAAIHRKVLDKYSIYFIDQMIAVLTASTVIFYTLYAVDERTIQNTGTHGLLYTVPFVYYGIFRYLYLVHKRRQGGDPSRVILKDHMLQLNVLLWLAAAIWVIYFGK